MVSCEVIFALGVAFLLVSYVIADGGFVSFGYTGNTPANWGNLSPKYKTCSSGIRQSPINIEKDDATIKTKFQDLHLLYVNANATLINNGFNVMLKFGEDVGFFSHEGKNYALKQLHWHTPSEHTIDKKQFPLELHLVHKSDAGSISVIAILYDFGQPDPFIHQLKDAVAVLAKEHYSGYEKTNVPVSLVRTKTLKRHTRRFFKYVGSLTTPPCTENVTWFIIGNVRKVSKKQVALIRSPLPQEFHSNARPTQPLNGRVVELYDKSKFNSL